MKSQFEKIIGRTFPWPLPWWFTWPASRCCTCRSWFLRRWPWSRGEETCSHECTEVLDRWLDEEYGDD